MMEQYSLTIMKVLMRPPWLAEEAYQLHWSEGILYKYLLCYEDRLIEIEFDWEPTEEQMKIVSEKLTGY